MGAVAKATDKNAENAKAAQAAMSVDEDYQDARDDETVAKEAQAKLQAENDQLKAQLEEAKRVQQLQQQQQQQPPTIPEAEEAFKEMATSAEGKGLLEQLGADGDEGAAQHLVSFMATAAKRLRVDGPEATWTTA